MIIDDKNIKNLSDLRRDFTQEKVKPLMDILLRYYPIGTEIVVTKDYWEVRNPESENLAKLEALRQDKEFTHLGIKARSLRRDDILKK